MTNYSNCSANLYDVAVIGAGPVGIFSVFASGMQDLNCALIEDAEIVGGQCMKLYKEKNIYDIPGFQTIKAYQLIDNLFSQASRFHPDLYKNTRIKHISEEYDKNGLKYFTLTSTFNITISAKAIILSIGAGLCEANKLQSEILTKEALISDKIKYITDNIKEYKDKHIAIVGGGDSALDIAIELNQIAKTITLIHKREIFNAHPHSVSAIYKKTNIVTKTPCSICKIHEEFDKLHVILSDDTTIIVDFLIPKIGVQNHIDFINQWGIAIQNNKILVNPATMQTTKEGIYAIGDCAQYNGKYKLIATGFSEAFIASKAIFKYINPKIAPRIEHSTSRFSK